MRVPRSAAHAAQLLCAIGLCAASAATPAASAAPVPAPWDCSDHYICFYRDSDGRGERCQYSQSNARANEICSWGLVNPKSVRNRSNDRVHYYREHNYEGRIGSTVAGDQGNLAGDYTIRSLWFD